MLAEKDIRFGVVSLTLSTRHIYVELGCQSFSSR